MCLNISLFARRKTAKRNIEVAKVLIVPLTDDGLNDSPLYTPFRRFPIDFGKLYTSELVRDLWAIEDGLHSYADADDAHFAARNLAHGRYHFAYYNRRVDVQAFRAIIPKGASYYFGKHGGAGASYASNQLIILNEYA